MYFSSSVKWNVDEGINEDEGEICMWVFSNGEER